MMQAFADLEIKTRLDGRDRAELIEPADGWRLSVFLPLENSNHEGRLGAATLRELRKQAVAFMESRGVPAVEKGELLHPLDAMTEASGDGIFQGQGMAIFASERMTKIVVLRDTPKPFVELDRNFRLDPLHQALAGRDRFRLLELNLHSIRLWEGDSVSMGPVSLDGIGTNIKDAVHFEDEDAQTRFRTNSGPMGQGSTKGQGSAYYGAGGESQDRKNAFLNFYRKVDHGLASKLAVERHLPLILAGVGYLMPIYREANSYPGLSALQIPGATHEEGSKEELHRKASSLLREAWKREIARSLDFYRENRATTRTVSGYADAVRTAYYKRLTHLFIRKGDVRWGTFSAPDGETEVFEGYRPGSVDLVNLAVARALMDHGRVYAIEDEDMPAGAGMAGICRT
jgi:release factor family 7